ncbi:MAG: DUF362 domain-containing protein, partial [Candidatus Lokiarchaeia archaeon]
GIFRFKGSYEESIWEIFKTFNLEDKILTYDTIVIKPNYGSLHLGYPPQIQESIGTDPKLVTALVKILKDNDVRRVIVAESGMYGVKIDRVYEGLELAKSVPEAGGELYNIDTGEFEKVKIDETEVNLSKVFSDCDFLINIPSMKTHILCTVSLGTKNIGVGSIDFESKAKIHREGIHRSITLLAEKLNPGLTIIDGIISHEYLGPTFGLPRKTNLLIAGDNAVSTDSVAATIMNIDPREIEHLKLASEHGFGKTNIKEIEIKGEKLEDSIVPDFQHCCRIEEAGEHYSRALGIDGKMDICGTDYCSGCLNATVGVVWVITNYTEGDTKPFTFVMGTDGEVPENPFGKVYIVGDCQAKNKDKGEFLPGCPPIGREFYQIFIDQCLSEEAKRKAIEGQEKRKASKDRRLPPMRHTLKYY